MNVDIKAVVAQRLRDCRKERRWTAEETAKRLGILPSRYSNWEQEIRSPKPENIFKLSEIFKKPPAWIAGYSNIETENVSDSFVSLFRPSVSIDGQNITIKQSINDTALSQEYIARRRLDANQVIAIRANDSSMSPTIDEGDEVLIDLSKNKIVNADLFAIVVNGQIWIRLIRPEINGKYTIASEDAAHFPNESLTAEELDQLPILGRVSRISKDR